MTRLKKNNVEPPWLSISDMMTVLMMLFLLCYICYVNINSQYKVRSDIKILLEDMISSTDVMSLESAIDNSGTMHLFDLNFANNDYQLNPSSALIIQKSFPVFIEAIEDHKDRIEKIRIEGHTSSAGSYIHNLELSQNRSREVLVFILTNLGYTENDWFYEKLTASGRSESEILFTNHKGELLYQSEIINTIGLNEDSTRSRRVTYGFDLISPDAQEILNKIRNRK